MTKAAAYEVRSRGDELDADTVGTLHSHCWRGLGRPAIVGDKHLPAWNEAYPQWRISSLGDGDVDDEGGGDYDERSPGRTLHDACTLHRSRLTPEPWPGEMAPFHAAWTAWKRENDLFDFEDLISQAYEDLDCAPENPAVIYGDEAQDQSASEFRLLRKWGEAASRGIVLVGDPDQTIYGFRGASPESFVDLQRTCETRVLEQSYRVPRAVHAVAQAWIRRIPSRVDVVYRPTSEAGEVRRSDADWSDPETIVQEIEAHVAAGRSVMCLAACGYMLDPLISQLRTAAMPFWNPYKRRNGRWNPLVYRKGVVTATDRVDAFLERRRTGGYTKGMVARWIEVVRAEAFRHGVKAAVAREAEGDPDAAITPADVLTLFADTPVGLAGWTAVEHGDLDWFHAAAVGSKARSLDFPIDICRKRGIEVLRRSPLVTVGTIHSVKGGEADVVYLFPDLSPSFAEEFDGRNPDSVIRLFYVGMTRARQTLVVCEAAGSAAADLDTVIKAA